jgi:heat shock protein HslJ
MRALPVLALSLAAVALVAACGGGSSVTPAPSAPAPAAPTPAAPTPADLDGRTFIVTGAVGYEPAAGSQIALTFEDGRLGVHAGCNQMGGGYDITDGRLVLEPMMSTEMACEDPLMAQDQWVAAFLPDAAVTLDGDTLTLVKGDVTLTATDKEVATPDKPLEGTTWVVDGLVTNQAVSSVPAGVTATLVFADGKVAVDTGCNTGSGATAIGEASITFGPVATTKMACEPAAMEVEQLVLAVLAGDVGYSIDADALQLRGAGGGLDLRAAS